MDILPEIARAHPYISFFVGIYLAGTCMAGGYYMEVKRDLGFWALPVGMLLGFFWPFLLIYTLMAFISFSITYRLLQK